MGLSRPAGKSPAVNAVGPTAFTWLSGENPSPRPEPFRLRSDAPTPSRVVLRVTCEIDMATSPVLAETLHFRPQAGEPGTELIADLIGVTFIDARGLATLVEAAEGAGSCGLVFQLVGRPPCLLRLLEPSEPRDALIFR